MKKALYLLSILLIALLAVSFTTTDWLEALLGKLEQYASKNPQEKVYIQLDKPYYSIGDDVWFKAYMVKADDNQPSPLSNTIFVSLLDESDSVRKTVVVPVENGTADGSFTLTDSLINSGHYKLIAYSSLMQNFDSDFYFTKDLLIADARTSTSLFLKDQIDFEGSKMTANIDIYNPLTDKKLAGTAVDYKIIQNNKSLTDGKAVTNQDGKLIVTHNMASNFAESGPVFLELDIPQNDRSVSKRIISVYNKKAKPDVQFFPESGKLVAGVRSKVGFKALGPDGFGIDLKGFIINQSNKKLFDFKSSHAGMGAFALQPTAGDVYTAVITDAAGAVNKYTLPKVENTGYVLSVNGISDDSLTVAVQAGKGTPSNDELAIVALQNSIVMFSGRLKKGVNSSAVKISNAKFNTGIVQFTLLSSSSIPLAERLSYIHHDDQINLTISSDKQIYNKREKVDLTVSATDDDKSPVQGNFSISVTDENKVGIDEDAETTILSNLLLTSDLHGYIEAPNYYFNTDNKDRYVHLDNLLLTQGWRRFKWTDAVSGKQSPSPYDAKGGISVSGQVLSLTNKPLPNSKVSIYATTENGVVTLDTVADASGRFIFKNIQIQNTAKFLVKAEKANGNVNAKIVFDVPPKRNYTSTPIINDFSTKGLLVYLQSTEKRFNLMPDGLPGHTIMLNEVKVKDKKVDRYTIPESAKLGTGNANIVLKSEEVEKYQNLWEIFYNKPGVEVRDRSVYSVGRVVSLTRPNRSPMLVRLNGMAVDQSVILDLQPSVVEGVEIFLPGPATAIYGNEGYWGVIEITTKKGGVKNYSRSTNINSIVVDGNVPDKEFYSPVYETKSIKSNNPDLRSTIYWNPGVNSDAEGKAKVSFYTADEPGTYRVTIEGLDAEGRLAHKVYRYNVK
ncbi:hypothetical protein FPZ43_03295 [Mucilaginibacter pallidiroseus]|uniref:TonB-dependent receptor plug domain-containing protein n=1 Tax=Mucilaginibacter pallidiroseus TaxID=2599295 RepID=A0A563UJG7_9SPHI|nr:hypothetical protein [Mucilaginibacter pallidiroseus]TWR31512.1 hypothetical protein FPZ43_03295 [Mucilaginibacter pallidiroseus]